MIVTVYSKPDCAACVRTKDMLARKNIPFQEIDVMEDAAALELVKSLGYRQMPVVVAGDTHWCGLRPDHIIALANG